MKWPLSCESLDHNLQMPRSCLMCFMTRGIRSQTSAGVGNYNAYCISSWMSANKTKVWLIKIWTRKTCFSAEPASWDLQWNGLLYFSASSAKLFLLYSVSYCIPFLLNSVLLFPLFLIQNLLRLLTAAYYVNLLLRAICGAIYRLLLQLQIISTALLFHPQPALPASSSL